MRLFSLLVLCLTLGLQAADFYVDNTVGDDAFDGLAQAPGAAGVGPKATITAALKAAAAGDTVHLNVTGKPYRQIANFYGLPGGEEGKPLTLDGHGATLDGADVCPADGWAPFAGATLERRDIVPRGLVMLDGTMVLMTHNFNVLEPGDVCFMPYMSNRLYFRPAAGKKHADHTVEVGCADGTTLAIPGAEWKPSHSSIGDVRRYTGLKEAPAWVKVDGKEVPLTQARDRLAPGNWTVLDGVFYFSPPAGKTPADCELLVCVRENGVMMNGNTKYVVVRNLNVQYVHNDGFNIHGNVTAAEFYNCNARDCGDEGFSAHDTCETLLDGAVYVNCDNGIANVNTAGYSITRNVILARARHVGYLLQGGAPHELTNAILVDNPSQVSIGNTKADNVLIVQTAGGPRCQALQAGANTVVTRLTAIGNAGLIRVGQGSSLTVSNAVLGAGQGAVHCRTDEPAAAIKLAQVRYAPEQRFEYGTKYPWTTLPLGEWLAGAGAAAATGCEAVEVVDLEHVPAGAGCSPELIARYRDWVAGE